MCLPNRGNSSTGKFELDMSEHCSTSASRALRINSQMVRSEQRTISGVPQRSGVVSLASRSRIASSAHQAVGMEVERHMQAGIDRAADVAEGARVPYPTFLLSS